MSSRRLRTGVIAIVAVALVGVGGFALSRGSHSARAGLSQGLDVLPADTRVAGFTDWDQIRTIVGDGGDVGLNTLVANAFDRGLSARSVLASSAPAMNAEFGWSIADLRWEMYGQASAGSVVVAGMGDDLAVGTVTDGLQSLGYTEDDGVWSIDPGAQGANLPGFGETLSTVAVLADKRLILTSSVEGYLDEVLAAERDRDTLAGVTAARQTAASLVGAPSSVLAGSKDTCESTGLKDFPDEVITMARNKVEPLGNLATVVYGGRAIYDNDGGQRMRFAMTFGSAALAADQLELRSKLSTGEFVGRNGKVEDVLALTHTHTDGPTLTLDFDFDGSKGAFMSGNGPVLFAACAVG